jgi:hypothetical protein
MCEKYIESNVKKIIAKGQNILCTITTPLTSFTDRLMPSVQAIKSVGKIITNSLTDGTRPSVYQSSVKPIFVANSVANKKTPTDGLTDGYTRAKKKTFPAGTLPKE